ncbi:hypothetical protein NJBCHELONAE_16940 [Mycobacteroides chelonae]|nr:hypothetical protein NJBCHELONAE_16940 [Mycobacteroides chelonae]
MDTNSLPAAVAVRDTLIAHVAETLRQLPPQDRTFVHLPRVLVPTEWAGWMHEVEVNPTNGRGKFGFIYQFSPSGHWNPQDVHNRFHALWRGEWGWDCGTEKSSPLEGAGLRAVSSDGYEVILEPRPRRNVSSLHLVSPVFDLPSAGPPVTMPFAVTPFGPLSLGTVWATHPEIFETTS